MLFEGMLFNNPTGASVRGGLGAYGSMVDLRLGDRMSQLAGYEGYGVSAADVGSGIGAGVGALGKGLIDFFTGGATRQQSQAQPYQQQYVPPLSWWDRQNTSTKILLVGGGFAALATAIVVVRGKK